MSVGKFVSFGLDQQVQLMKEKPMRFGLRSFLISTSLLGAIIAFCVASTHEHIRTERSWQLHSIALKELEKVGAEQIYWSSNRRPKVLFWQKSSKEFSHIWSIELRLPSNKDLPLKTDIGGNKRLFEAIAALPQLRSLYLSYTDVTNDDLVLVGECRALRRLHVQGTDIGDAGIAQLANISQFTSLDLYSTQITDEGLYYLRQCTGLEWLFLGKTSVTDAGLEHLAALPLQYLRLWGENVTSDGLVHLANMRTLKQLFLGNTNISDEGLEHLSNLQLRELDLHGTSVTSLGVVHLTKIDSLQRLDLSDTNVTDDAIDSLLRMKKLRWLDLDHTDVTESGFKRLKREMPKADVGWSKKRIKAPTTQTRDS